MVDFKKLSDRAKDLVDKRGGTDGLKRDADKLKNIATGRGSISDKAKAAAQALKETPREEQAKAAPKQAPAAKKPASKKPAAKSGGAKKAGAAKSSGAKKPGARKAPGGAKKAT